MSAVAPGVGTGPLAHAPVVTLPAQVQRQTRGVVRDFIRRKPLGALGGAVVLVLILTAIFAGQIAPFAYDAGISSARLQGPSLAHWFGTDNLGRDMFSRVVWGSRISVAVGFGAVFVGTGLATVLGVVSGYVGGAFDLLFQRIIDIWISFPAIILLVFLVSVFTTRNTDPFATIFIVALTLGLIVASGTSRVIRSAVVSVRHTPYIEAELCLGAGHLRMLTRHVLPNVFAPILILATTQLGGAILAESTLSFLGFGVKPPMPAWGSMLSGSGRDYFLQAPWMALWPGLAITLAVFGFNMLGDALRDVLDPRLRGSDGSSAHGPQD
jgi:peptide/nickel transport system permease protein